MKKLVLIFCLVMLPLTLASDTQHRFKVYVEVSGDDERTVRTIESYLKRELRLLGDVDIVGSEDGDWKYMIKFFVMALEWKDLIGEEVYAIAKYQGVRLPKMAYTVPEGYKSFPATVSWTSILSVAKCPEGKLPQLCIEYIGSFDKNRLQPERK